MISPAKIGEETWKIKSPHTIMLNKISIKMEKTVRVVLIIMAKLIRGKQHT